MTSHRCFGKIRRVKERIGLLLTHDEITYLCEGLWNCKDEGEFYDRMNNMSDDELKAWVKRAMRKRKILQNYLETVSVYN